MTWIKPSFLCMMYRCGWASKPGVERVLAVETLRSGFEWAVARACLSHYDRSPYPDRDAWVRRVKTSPVRAQWDLERSLRLAPLPYRALQVGLSGEAVGRYVDEWIVTITEATGVANAIRNRLAAGDDVGAADLLPAEAFYPLPAAVGAVIGAAPFDSGEGDPR